MLQGRVGSLMKAADLTAGAGGVSILYTFAFSHSVCFRTGAEVPIFRTLERCDQLGAVGGPFRGLNRIILGEDFDLLQFHVHLLPRLGLQLLKLLFA